MLPLHSLLAAQLCAIPGVPETLPGQDPTFAFFWSNDCIAFPMAMSAKENDPNDDWRTNQFTALGRFRSWRWTIDDSMLTSKPRGLRVDELTATAGYDFGPVVAGAGARVRSHFGGQGLQNWYHQWNHDMSLHLAYDDDRADAVAYALLEMDGPRIDGIFTIDPVAAVLAASNGESAEDLGFRLHYHGTSFESFIGARYQWRDGGDSHLIADVQQRERGAIVEYGFSRPQGHFSFSVSYSPEYHAGVGQLGLNW